MVDINEMGGNANRHESVEDVPEMKEDINCCAVEEEQLYSEDSFDPEDFEEVEKACTEFVSTLMDSNDEGSASRSAF